MSTSRTPANISSNIDACKEKGSELWVPGTSAEHHFVKQTFPGAEVTHVHYHIGILKYSKNDGFYGVDHSYHVGSPYFSLDTNMDNNDGEFINDGSGACLVFNKGSELWEKQDTCGDAIGVCKSKLGMNQKHVLVFKETIYKILRGL